jgi:trk system potassium uptake protein TrkA
VGAGLATRLALDGHTVGVIDQDPGAFARLGGGFSGRTLAAMGLDRAALIEMGAERADGLAAVTGSDEINAVIGRVASRRFGVPRVVARVYDPAAAEVYRRLGVHTISPVEWGVSRLAELLMLVETAMVAPLGAGQVDLVEAVVPPLLDGRPIGELEVAGEIRAAAITRAGRTFVPDGATHLQAHDIVSLAVAGVATERLEALLGRRV